MKTSFWNLFVFVLSVFFFSVTILVTTSYEAEATEVAGAQIHIDDNGVEGTGYGSIDEPTPVTPVAINAETGLPIDIEQGIISISDTVKSLQTGVPCHAIREVTWTLRCFVGID